jgi:hypothetical protein
MRSLEAKYADYNGQRDMSRIAKPWAVTLWSSDSCQLQFGLDFETGDQFSYNALMIFVSRAVTCANFEYKSTLLANTPDRALFF